MRTFGVVVNVPFLDNPLGFLETVEDLANKAFILELACRDEAKNQIFRQLARPVCSL